MHFFNCPAAMPNQRRPSDYDHTALSVAPPWPMVCYFRLTLGEDAVPQTHGVTSLTADERAALHRLARLTDEFLAQDRIPDLDALAAAANMQPDTVKYYLQLLDFEPVCHPLRLKTDQILLALYRSANKGNVASIKLWLQLFEAGFVKPTAPTTSLPILDVIAEVQNADESRASGAVSPSEKQDQQS